jgi:hypothetical protein
VFVVKYPEDLVDLLELDLAVPELASWSKSLRDANLQDEVRVRGDQARELPMELSVLALIQEQRNKPTGRRKRSRC